MIEKIIKFEDLEGAVRTETFWFHLSKAELAELKIVHGGGLEGLMGMLNVARDGQLIMDTFRTIIEKTVGCPNKEDGVSFEKDPTYVKRFMNSDAYSVLFMELLDSDNMSNFIVGCLPKDLQDEARKRHAEQSTGPAPWITENREPTKAELNSMTKEQMFAVMERRAASN